MLDFGMELSLDKLMEIVMKQLIIIILLLSFGVFAQYPAGEDILDKIDQNMSSDSRVFTSNKGKVT